MDFEERARDLWARATGDEKYFAQARLWQMDNCLRAAGKTRADIAVTDAEVEKARIEGYLEVARHYWKGVQDSVHPPEVPPPWMEIVTNPQQYIQGMDEALEAAGKTRADIGVTDAEVVAALQAKKQ